MDRTTGKLKGMGFVTFASDDSAAAAVAQAEQQIGGHSVEVLKAAPKPDRRGGGGPIRAGLAFPEDPFTAGFIHAQRMMMGISGGAPMMPPSNDREPRPPDHRPRAFVRDVPEELEDAVLQRHFEKFGEVSDLYQPEHKGAAEGKRKKGIAYVTYKTEQALSACLAQGETHTVEGASLQVTRADPRREFARPGVASYGGGGAGFDMPYGRAPSPSRGRPDFVSGGPSRTEAQNKRIFAGGIPPELSSDQVAEHFRKYGGDIADIYFPKDKHTGSKRGFCYITFQDNLSVHRAVANAPREINGLPIGEVKVAEARPSDFGGPAGGGRVAPRGSMDRGGDMVRYGYGGVGGEGRGRGSYDGSSFDDGSLGWSPGMMGGAAMLPMGSYAGDMAFGARAADHWSAGAGAYGIGAFADNMPRDGGEMMERMAPLINLLASGGAANGFPSSSTQAAAAYGAAGGGGWGQAGAPGGLPGLPGQRDLDARYRPY